MVGNDLVLDILVGQFGSIGDEDAIAPDDRTGETLPLEVHFPADVFIVLATPFKGQILLAAAPVPAATAPAGPVVRPTRACGEDEQKDRKTTGNGARDGARAAHEMISVVGGWNKSIRRARIEVGCLSGRTISVRIGERREASASASLPLG